MAPWQDYLTETEKMWLDIAHGERYRAVSEYNKLRRKLKAKAEWRRTSQGAVLEPRLDDLDTD